MILSDRTLEKFEEYKQEHKKWRDLYKKYFSNEISTPNDEELLLLALCEAIDAQKNFNNKIMDTYINLQKKDKK